MVSKKNIKVLNEKSRDEKQRFSIRKLSVGAASVLIGLSFMAFNGQSVSAATDGTSTQDSAQTVTGSETNEAPSNNNEDNNKSATEATSAKTDNIVSTQADESKNEVKSETAEAASSQQNESVNKEETVQEKKADQQTDSPEKTDKATKTESETEKSDDTTTEAKDAKINNEKNAKDANKAKVVTDRKLSLAATAEAEDPNAVTVTTAQELMQSLQEGTATTINIANNINMGDIKTGENINVDITNKRNITIQSSGETKNTVDFNGYSFKMNSNDYGVTFKDITLYGRSYFGIVRNAGSYTFDNVDYTGSQLVYTEAGYNSTVNFNGTVNASSVASYVGLNGTTYKTQGGGNQQVLQFRSGTNTINFNEDSTVNLVTTNANVIENGGGTTNINVKKGANVILEPHTQTGMEQFFSVDGIARGIASNATTNLTIDEGANLNISLKDNPDDAYHSSALYLNSGATINNNGNLTITSDGVPYYKSSGIDAPVYINDTAVINVGNTGNLTLTATNLGTYNGDLMKINGTGTVSLDPHSTFKISGDGTGALTAINLSSGSTFTSDQPKEFTIDLSANTNTSKSLIKNGTIDFTRVKNTNVNEDFQKPLGIMTVTYDGTGKVTSYTISSQDEGTTTKVANHLESDRSNVRFVAAGEDVTLSDVHLSKDNKLTGTVSALAEGNSPIYIWVEINGKSVELGNNSYTVYTDNNGNITSSVLNAAGSTGNTGGQFEIDLSSIADQLTNDAKISVVATRYFVDSKTIEGTVADFRKVDTTTLQDLVDAAPTEEAKPSYYNASEEAQMAYNNAIKAGQEILDNPTSYDQSDVDRAASVIQLALTALTGKETDKTALQAAIDDASAVESSDNYTNADAKLQDDYQAAIKAGQATLSKENATQTEVDNALTTINTAKAALNGDTKKSANKEALQQAVDEAPTVKANDAAYYNGTEETKKAYDDAISAGRAVLDKENPTASEVKDALDAINAAKGNLNGKATNIEALETALTTANNAKGTGNYTNSDQAKQEALTNAINAGQEVLKNTKATQAEVDSATKAITDAINGLNGDTNLENAKNAAIKVVDEALTDQTKLITDATNLSDSEKQDLIKQVTDAANEAKDKISSATTNDTATQAGQDGKTAIEKVVPTSLDDAKNAANQVVEDALNKKLAEIQKATNLTDEEKAKLESDATDAANTAKENIAKATTNDSAAQAGQDGAAAIDNVKVPADSAVKQAAKDAIDAAAKTKDAAIDASTLTDEEKASLKKDISDAVKAAKDAIDAATTDSGVTTAKDNGVTAINDIAVPSESAAKQAAKDAVAKAADEKNAAIDSSNLTDEEKAALKQKVTDAQTAANTAIDAATTNATVTDAQTNGVNAIDNIAVPTSSASKDQATTDLNKAVEEAKNAIDQDNNLTDEEKQAAKDQVDTDAKTAQDAINNAKTDNDVNDAVNNGKVAIDKDVANAAIDNAAAGKLKEIKDPLTAEEKKTYTDLINAAVNNAKQNIANATTAEEVSTAQTNGVDAINKIEVPTTSTVKDNAIKAIDQALQDKTDAINKASNLNSDEKTDLINQATEAANTAKNNINNATTDADVNTAQTNGEKAIADVAIPNLSDVKKESIDLVNKALDAKTDEINNASNLSQDEKQNLINDATKAATDAINNINQSKTNDDAKSAANTGVQNIENVTIPSLDDAKKNANQAIDDALNSKLNEINNASNLNEAEKQKLVDQANDAAATAKKNVENATTNDAARDAANTGIENIKGITFTSLEDAKNAANDAIDNALANKTAEINKASNLSTDEKQDLINQANTAAQTAKDNINNATTNDAVTEAQNKGIEDIANVNVPSLDQVKQDAINAIKQVQDAKNKQIAAASNLSTDEQKALTDQVDKFANDAIAKINDAATTTNDAVTATRDDAIKQITDLFIPTLDGAQKAAINAIENAKNSKLNDINNASHLTDQEKQALIDQVNKAADDATKAINDATTNDAVKSAETAGLDNINNITIPSIADKQQAAIEELNKARDSKISDINNATDLTTDEKDRLKDQVQNEYSNAVSNVTNAATDEAVTTAKDAGVKAIDAVVIPTHSDTKDQAKKDITDAADDAKRAIDQDSHLTDDQKQAAKDQIDSDAKKAQDAIDNAKTDKDVDDAINNGKVAIDKDVANAAIDDAAATKKEEISKAPLTTDEAKELNNLVDQEAKAAKEAINNANTASDVDKAKNSGVEAINNISVPTTSTAKDEANKAIDDALANKTKEINNAANLSDQEKQNLIDQANQEAAKAKESVKNATSDEAVKKATDAGVDAIANVTVPSLDDAKNNASQVIDDVLKQKEDEINNAAHLTDQEKQDLINKAQDAAKEAKDKINQATTNDDVAKERDTGVEKIANIVVPSLDEAKNNATKAIDEALADKTKQINDATNLSDQEKNDLIKQITDIADKAKDKIKTDTTDAEISNDEKDAINNIVNTEIPGLNDHKNNAQTSLDEAKSTKLNEINKASNLTTDEKNDLIQKVNDEYNKALENINNATTNDEVDKAAADGVTNILNIHVPSLDEKKQNSVDALNEVREAKKQEINKASNLSQDEKDKLTKQVDQIADNAINEIKGADNDQAAKAAEEKGIQNILDVKVPSLDEVKTNAKQAIADALESKTNEINSATNLDPATKQDLINQAKDEADKAIKNIEAATNNDEALDASDKGVKNINDIKVPSLDSAIDSALNAIQAELTKKLDEINKATYLSQTQRDDLTSKANQAAETAINAINAAKTNTAVQEAAQTGVNNIRAITVPAQNIDDNTPSDNTQTALDAAKSQAIDAINQALAKKTNEINSANHLSTSEKNELINKANEIADQAKANINNATNEGEVTLAKNNGVAAINAIAIPSISNAKSDALSDIDKAANAKNEEINRANLTPSEKEALRNELNRIVSEAKANINKAGTLQDVQAAKENGIIAINAIAVNAKSADNAIVVSGDKSAQTVQNQAKSTSNKSNKIQKSAKNQLPQTGKSNDVAAAVGGAVAAMTGLISLLGTRKKKED